MITSAFSALTLPTLLHCHIYFLRLNYQAKIQTKRRLRLSDYSEESNLAIPQWQEDTRQLVDQLEIDRREQSLLKYLVNKETGSQ